jgi:hypothetical protein
MKNPSRILFVVPWIVIACYIGWSFLTGSLRIRGREEPIRLKDNPREYRYNLTIIIVIFVVMTAIFAWMFL